MRGPARRASRAGSAAPRGAGRRRALAACWLAAALLAGSPARGAAGEASAVLSVPAGPVTVGDPVALTLRVTHPRGASVDTPDLSGLSPKGSPSALVVEAVEPVLPPEGGRADPGSTSWVIHARAFDTGDLALGSIALTYRLAGSAPGEAPLSVSTAPAILKVRSVLESPEADPADIKGPWSLPASLLPLLFWGLGLAAAAVLAAYLWRRWRRRRAAPEAAPAAPEAPRLSPYEEALRELERLLASGLLASGRLKEFHVALAEIVKKLLGAVHGFEALDRTTEEVLGDLPRSGAREETVVRTARFLLACDLVKFAKHRPAREEIDATVTLARALIETGRAGAAREAAA